MSYELEDEFGETREDIREDIGRTMREEELRDLSFDDLIDLMPIDKFVKLKNEIIEQILNEGWDLK